MGDNLVLPSTSDELYKRSGSELTSVDLQTHFSCNALSVLDVYSPKLPHVPPFGGVYNGSFVDTGSETSETMDCSDVSDSSIASSCTTTNGHRWKSIGVKCLESYEELENKCKLLGLKFVDLNNPQISKEIVEDEEKEYEVDLILDDKVEKGQKYYFVKWKHYESISNTWEPDYHLTGCLDMIEYYETLKSPEDILNPKIFCYFVKDLVNRRPLDNITLIRLMSIITATSEESIKKMNYTTTQLRFKVSYYCDIPVQKLKYHKKKLLLLMRYAEKRKHVLINLKEWECEINSQNPATYIQVENNVDLEKAPSGFKFIHDYVSNGIEINAEPAVFCSCDCCFASKSSCCPGDSEGHFAYNKYGRLQLHPGYPIYECNKYCRCDKDCVNRVVQHGSKIKVAIFRTSNGCGWGLKALETIQKDQFVLEYLGEILTSDEAELRGREYDNIGRSYLFDLDFNECKYTVDAAHVGNAAHFINHSCEPNIHVFAVWINCQDPHLPRLAFFAKKKINRGEELTFDYKMFKNHCKDNFGTSNSSEGKMLCKCKARRCRKYLC